MHHNTPCHGDVLHHEEYRTVRQWMRGAGRRVMVMLRSRFSEMMDQVRARHDEQRQERQYRPERTETAASPATASAEGERSE